MAENMGLNRIPFFKYGFIENEMLWAHMLGGAVLGKIINSFLSPLETILIIAGVALVWEMIEYVFETPNKKRIIEVYGSTERYLYDTAGDIMGALLLAALVVF